MIYKTFEEWKAGHWLEDGEPRTEAYTEDELLLVEMGWKYGFDAGKEQTKPQQWHMVNKDGYVKPLSDEEIWEIITEQMGSFYDGNEDVFQLVKAIEERHGIK